MRLEAVRTLGSIAAADDRCATEAVAAKVFDEDRYVRRATVDVLAPRAEAAVDDAGEAEVAGRLAAANALKVLLKDADPHVCRAATAAVAAAEPNLEQALHETTSPAK